MNNPCIVYEKVNPEDKDINKRLKKPTLRFFKKDKTHVDKLDSSCIMGYVEASELEMKLKHGHPNIKFTTLKDIVLKPEVIKVALM